MEPTDENKFLSVLQVVFLIIIVSLLAMMIVLGGFHWMERSIRKLPRCFPPFTMVEGETSPQGPTGCIRKRATDDGLRTRSATQAENTRDNLSVRRYYHEY